MAFDEMRANRQKVTAMRRRGAQKTNLSGTERSARSQGKGKPDLSSARVAKRKGSVQKAKTFAAANQFRPVSKAVAKKMLEILCCEYPDADCELKFKNPYELLISVILSAQTTDVQVNRVTGDLFKRFPVANDLAESSIDEIKEIIKPTGYYNAKAENIQRCAAALHARYGGAVPDSLEELTTLPGVGRKTANVVLGVLFNKPAWTVDTHVIRLSGRLGLSGHKDPYKIELDLQKLFPKEDWSKHSITLIWHGRRCCFARNPDCPGCPINHLCPASTV